MNSTLRYALICCVALQAGCGGGGGGNGNTEPAPAPAQGPLPLKILLAVPDGSWQGTTTDSAEPELSMRAFVVGQDSIQFDVSPHTTGEIAFFGPSSRYIASINQCCAFLNRVTATTNGIGEPPGTAAISVSHSYGAALTVTVERAGVSRTFRLERNMTKPELISPQALAGVYSGTYSSYVSTPKAWMLTIESEGRVTGTDDYGCAWSGTAQTSLSPINTFKLSLEATGCSAQAGAPLNGTYVAMGRYSEAAPTRTRYPGQPVIDFTIVGPVWLGAQMLAR